MASILAVGTVITITNEVAAAVVIGGVTGFSAGGGTAADIRTTTMASAAHTYAVGLPDRGDFTMELIRDIDDVGQVELFDASKDLSEREIVILFPSGTLNTFTFQGVVKSLTTDGEIDGVLTGSATIKISGEIVESTTV